MKTKSILLCSILLHCSILKSQVPTEQDCPGAILICTPIYTNSDLNSGQGNYTNETGPGTCQIQGEINSVWLKFSVIASGDLAFTIFPTSNMDFDWALYNLTNDSCASISTDGSLLSSCNSSEYAITGISSTGVGNWNSFGPTNAFNYLLPVFSGELYYLQINNFYGAPGGFTIDFTASTATLFDCNTVSFSATQTSLCEKFCIDFVDQSLNSPTSWQWIFEGGIPGSSELQDPNNICYSIPGTYDVTLITTNSIGNDTLTLTDYVTVNPTPPFPVITQNGYTLSSSEATGYQWQFNTIDIPAATNQSYDVQQSGYYTIVITDENGCVSSTTTYILIDGMEENNGDSNVLIYPNPSNGNFIVELLNDQIAGELKIEIRNTLGQIVFSEDMNKSAAHWKKEIDLCSRAMNCLTAGIYFMKISAPLSSGNSVTRLIDKKLVVAK